MVGDVAMAWDFEEDCDLRGIATLARGELGSEGRRSRLVGEATLTSLDKKLGAIYAVCG